MLYDGPKSLVEAARKVMEKSHLRENKAAGIIKKELEKMGKSLEDLSPDQKKALFNKVEKEVDAEDEDNDGKKDVDEAKASPDQIKLNKISSYPHVKKRMMSAGKGKMDVSYSYMGKELATKIDAKNVSQNIFITKAGEDFLKKNFKEDVSEMEQPAKALGYPKDLKGTPQKDTDGAATFNSVDHPTGIEQPEDDGKREKRSSDKPRHPLEDAGEVEDEEEKEHMDMASEEVCLHHGEGNCQRCVDILKGK